MVSVCFITKNEEMWLGGCIDQLAGIVSEIIVVDTGSTDRTLEIAKSRGAKIFSYAWNGSFSDARNFSLTKATQPWILKIDPDERIDRDQLLKLIEYTRSDALAVRCRTRTYTNAVSAMTEDAYQPCRGEFPKHEKGYGGFKELMYARLFKNIPGARYSGLVHEDIEPSLRSLSMVKDPIRWEPEILFHHYGNDLKTAEAKNKAVVYKKMMEDEVVRNSENGFVWYELGNLYYQEGEFQKAAETFRRAHELDVNSLQTLNNLGHTLTLSGKREEGEKILKECLAKDSTNSNVWTNLATSRMEAGDFKAAVQCLQHALSLSGDSLVAWRAFGQCLAQLGDFENSESAFRSALQRASDYAEAKIDLAILLGLTGKTREAAELVTETLSADPSNPRALELKSQFSPPAC